MEEESVMNKVELGSVFKMVLTLDEGVKPKHPGDSDRTKYFVVLGSDDEGVVVGAVLINSQINPRLFSIIGPYQHLVKSLDYPFLSKPESYIDCYNIKEIKLERIFKESVFIGKLKDDDISAILSLAVSSPANKKAVLSRYHLIDKR